MKLYEMEGFLRGKCLPGDLLVGESNAEYLVRKLNEAYTLKAERDALERQLSMSEAKCKGYFSDAAAALVKCDALAVENAGFKHALSVILEHVDVTDKGQAGVVAMIANDALFNSEAPATDAALAAIEARGVEKAAAALDALSAQSASVTTQGNFRAAAVYLRTTVLPAIGEAK